MTVPRELEIALNGPICPQLLRDDAIVINKNGWYRTITPSSPWAADDNEILFSNLNEQDADGEIETIIAEYQKLGRPMRWCVYPWTQPANLGERLLKRGATRSDVRVFLSATSLPLQSIKGVEIEQVDPASDEAYNVYINIIASGEMSSGRRLPANEVAFRRQRYRALIAGPKPTMQLFLARCDGEVAGCCATILKEDYGYMTGAYITPAFQGRGVFQSILAGQHRALRDKGITLSCGHARADTSAPWLERFGFTPVLSYNIYQIDPPIFSAD